MKFQITSTNNEKVTIKIGNTTEIFHNVIDHDLLAEYGATELAASTELAAAINAGDFTVKDEQGLPTNFSKLTDYAAKNKLIPYSPLNNRYPDTAHGGQIKQGTIFEMHADGTINNIPIKRHTTITAIINDPGQHDVNWNIILP